MLLRGSNIRTIRSDPLGVIRVGSNLGLNTTLVLALEDAKVTILTPGRIPRVGNLPVLNTIINTPTHDLDGMATFGLAGAALVDTTSVIFKVRVDGESGFDWTICHDFMGNGIGIIGLDGNTTLETVLVLRVDIVGGSGRGITLGGTGVGPLRRTARGTLSRIEIIKINSLSINGAAVVLRSMVVAVRHVINTVGLTKVITETSGIKSTVALAGTSNKTLELDVFPRNHQSTTVATIRGGTETETVRRERDDGLTAGSDA